MNYISMDSSKDIIEHYGIKGMRWGIRSRHADLMDNHRSYKKDEETTQIYSERFN